MLGLPSSTQIRRVISRKMVFDHFGAELSAERRKKIEAEIARMTLVNEVSPFSVNLAEGEAVKNFFVLDVALKTREFDAQNIACVARLFGQRRVLVLEAEGQARLAVWQGRLILGPWAEPSSLTLPLRGLNLDKVWENIAAQLANVRVGEGQTLDEALERAARREKLQREIARLEKRARAERQPKKKFELAEKIRKQRNILEEFDHG